MKKIFGFLLSAGLLLGFTACGGDDDNGEPDPGPGDKKFSCVVKTTPAETSVDVTATPAKGFTDVSYQLWVVKQGDYKAEVPATAESCKGTFTKTFDGLTAGTDYYVVVYEETAGYVKTSFKTNEAVGPGPDDRWSKGSNYFTLTIDADSYKVIENKVTTDLRPDDLSVFIDIWEYQQGLLSPGTCSGPNALGQAASWTSFIVTPGKDWFGAAYRLINPKQTDISVPNPDGTMDPGKVTQEAYDAAQARRAHLQDFVDNAGDYVLHLFMKSDAAGNYSIAMFNSGDDKKGGISTVIGTETSTYGFKRDGEWHEIEIPMSVFVTSPAFDITGVNVISITQSGQPFPKDINLDAVFIYKPAK